MKVTGDGERWSESGIYMGSARWNGGASPVATSWRKFQEWHHAQRKLASEVAMSWHHQSKHGSVQWRAAVKRLHDLQILYEENKARIRAGEFAEWHPSAFPELEYGLKPEERAENARNALAAANGTSDMQRHLQALQSQRPPPPTTVQRSLDFDDDPVAGSYGLDAPKSEPDPTDWF